MNDKGAIKIICRNRKAYFEYAIDALYEAGLVLKGTEVKSLRQGKANIDDAFARFQGNELFLYNAHISPIPSPGRRATSRSGPGNSCCTAGRCAACWANSRSGALP